MESVALRPRPGCRPRSPTSMPTTPARRSSSPRSGSSTPTRSWRPRRGRLASDERQQREVLALTAAAAAPKTSPAHVRQQQSAALVALQRWIGLGGEELLPRPTWSPSPTEDAVCRRPSVGRGQAARHRGARRQDTTVTRQRAQARTGPGASRTGSAPATRTWCRSGSASRCRCRRRERQDRDTAAKLALVEKAEAELAEAHAGGKRRIPRARERQRNGCRSASSDTAPAVLTPPTAAHSRPPLAAYARTRPAS